MTVFAGSTSRAPEGAAGTLAWRCRAKRRLTQLAVLAALAAPVAPGIVHGHGANHDSGHGQAADTLAADIELREASLLDRRGERVRFPDEALGDRVVVLSFDYTSCTTTCPVTTELMLQVEDGLAAMPGHEQVRLVTITIDPATDVPSRLADYADSVGAGDDWLWLTGEVPAVTGVLTGLKVHVPNIEEHRSVFLVGDAGRGGWHRYYGFPEPERLLDRVRILLETRMHGGPAGTEEGS